MDGKMTYPKNVQKAISMICDAGYEAFVVGGAVRDSLLGRDCNDFDLTTSALPEETARIFEDYRVIETGIKHGTVTVILDGEPMEITTYRVDGSYMDSRHPDVVTFTRSINEDLARRDFTVNAMAHNPRLGLVDIFGGREDLAAGLIRAVGDPMRRFEEDALRILRAFRFASKLGFDIEEKTLAAARERKELLRNISAERKTAELEGILLGKYVKKALELMKAAGVIEVVAPAFNLDKQRLDGIESLPCDFVCRVSFCLIGGNDTDKYVSSLRLSNATSSRVRRLVSMGSEPLAAENDRELRRLMARAGDELEYLIEIRRHLGQSTEGIAERARAIRERGDCLCLSDLVVDGRALSELGIRGKSIGNTLSGLLEAVLDDPTLNRREWLLAEAARLNENGREN